MKLKALSQILLMIIVVALSSCTEVPAYVSYESIADQTWDRNNEISFDVDMQDTISLFDIVVNIRNTTNYRYQNFWMFIESESPEGTVEKDTVECILANNRGEWLGNGFFSIHEMPVLYLNNIQFPQKGNYHFEIRQAMRDSILLGIHEVGLNIIKKEQFNGEK